MALVFTVVAAERDTVYDTVIEGKDDCGECE